jgi:tetratricopeptide (TPR) repeat protein
MRSEVFVRVRPRHGTTEGRSETGERTMIASRTSARAAGLVLAGLVLAAPLRAGGDEDLRERALALNRITGKDTIKGEVRVLLADRAAAKRLLAVAAKMAKKKAQPFGPNATLVLATVANRLDDAEAGEVFYKLHAEQSVRLMSESGLADAYGGLIDLCFRAKKYAECEKLCREVLEIDGSDAIDKLKSPTFQRLILAMALQGQHDKALEILDRLLKKQPDSLLVLEMKGQVLHDAGRVTEAAKAYEQFGEAVRADKGLKEAAKQELSDGVRYTLSGLYIELDQVDKAAELLKALLAREPDNPTYNNDLGYVWADHDMNLAESERLIRKALEEDRRLRRRVNGESEAETGDNPAYLDSLGWVLFKQKKYRDALPLLQQAVRAEQGRHLEIYDHLGDVYQALGEKKEAVDAWKKGVEIAGKAKRDQQRKAAVEKKIQGNK